MSTASNLLPERKRNYRFVLTPLADAMFQLLIFFMLTTTLTPYSLVTLRGSPNTVEETEATAPAGAIDETAEPAEAPPASAADTTIWSLGLGTVVTRGQVYNIDQLSSLAEAIGSQDDPGRVVILVGDVARVQDVASALAALDRANVEAVQIARTRN